MPEHANEHDLERAEMLGKAPTGSGEDCDWIEALPWAKQIGRAHV